MKRIAFFLIMCLPVMAMAQSNWEVPKQNAPKTEMKTEKKVRTEKQKAVKVQEPKKVADAVIKEADRPYLKGAVPEVDGKVVFNTEIEAPGKSAAEVYDMVYAELERLTQDEHQMGDSRIALVNREEKSIVATLSEWLVFSDKLLVLDRAEMSYVVLAKCTKGKADITIERITYKYDTDRNPGIMTAEELISDKVMLSNNGTKLRKQNSKFRKKTVDRMKSIVDELKRGIK